MNITKTNTGKTERVTMVTVTNPRVTWEKNTNNNNKKRIHVKYRKHWYLGAFQVMCAHGQCVWVCEENWKLKSRLWDYPPASVLKCIIYVRGLTNYSFIHFPNHLSSWGSRYKSLRKSDPMGTFSCHFSLTRKMSDGYPISAMAVESLRLFPPL